MFFEKYETLKNAIIANEDANEAIELIDFLDSRVSKMPEYMVAISNHVIGVNSALSMMSAGYLSQENYQNRVETLDSKRRSSHNVAMDAMNQINRMCDRYDVSHVCPDDEDRYVRANFAAAVTVECFMTDHKHSKEDIDRMYVLVHADSGTQNVDQLVDDVQKGGTIVQKRKLSEIDR